MSSFMGGYKQKSLTVKAKANIPNYIFGLEYIAPLVLDNVVWVIGEDGYKNMFTENEFNDMFEVIKVNGSVVIAMNS